MLQSHLSAVRSERDAAVCLSEAVQTEHLELQEVSTEVDADHFQSHLERLECEMFEVEMTSRRRLHWLASWAQPHNLVGRKPTPTAGAGSGTSVRAYNTCQISVSFGLVSL